jgi:hypothetical protein
MGLNYQVQESWFALGTSASPVALTTAFSGNVSSAHPVGHFSQMTICFDYTPGAGGGGNSVQIKVEGTPDLLDNSGVTPVYFQETASATSSGTVTHFLAEHTFVGAVAATSYKGMFYVPPSFLALVISAKETVGGGAAGTLKVRVIGAGF